MNYFIFRWIKLSLVALVGCGFLALAVYAFIKRDEIRAAQVEPPLITVSDQPLKTRPEQPGGMDIPNRDKLVFDLLDSSSSASVGVSAAAVVLESPSTATSPSLATVAVPSAALEPLPRVAEPKAALPLASVPADVSTGVVPAAKVAQPEPAKASVEAKVSQTVDAQNKQEAVPAASKNGAWGVQLAAVGSRADGDAAARQLKAKFSPLKPLSVKIAAAPGGKKYRVQFFGLKDRAAAAAICAKMPGQACFPVGK